jgi:hypothetical protein
VIDYSSGSERSGELFLFLRECLERLGKRASVLFRRFDLRHLNVSDISILSDCANFEWSCVTDSIGSVISGLINEIVHSKVVESITLHDIRAEISLLDSDRRRDISVLSDTLSSLRSEFERYRRETSARVESRFRSVEKQSAQQSLERNNLQSALTVECQARKNDVTNVMGRCDDLEAQVRGVKESLARDDARILATGKEITTLHSAMDHARSENSTSALEEVILSYVCTGVWNRKVTNLQMQSINDSQGVIGWLRSQESPFDRRIVVCQSSKDLIALVNPDSSDWYGSSYEMGAWVEFRFWSPIEINGLEMSKCTKATPRSFDLINLESGATQLSVRNADWNVAGGKLVVRFESIRTSALKIVQTGPNQSGEFYLNFGKIEFLSPDPKYRSGVYRTLFDTHRTDIRRYIEVRARDADPEELHLINPRTWTGTHPGKPTWIQVEVIGGQCIAVQYRLKRHSNWLIRSWTLRGSNSSTIPLDDWTILDRQEENTRGSFGELSVFDACGGSFRFFRLVQESPRWDGKEHLLVVHFELFGSFIPDT